MLSAMHLGIEPMTVEELAQLTPEQRNERRALIKRLLDLIGEGPLEGEEESAIVALEWLKLEMPGRWPEHA